MLWTWVLICLILGELLLYFILSVSKTWLPYRISPPIRSKIFFYILCLGLFVMGGISFFSYTETQKRLQDLDAVYGQIVALVEVGDTIMLMESSQRGFLITGSQNYLDPYNKLRETMDRKLEATKKLYENTLDQSRVNALSELIKERIVILDRNIEIKKTGKEEAIEQNLLMKEGRNTMDMIVVTGRDLQDRRRTEREKIVSGFRALGSVRVYMSFTLMVAALVQMLFAAILGRSKIPIQPYRPASDETFFP